MDVGVSIVIPYFVSLNLNAKLGSRQGTPTHEPRQPKSKPAPDIPIALCAMWKDKHFPLCLRLANIILRARFRISLWCANVTKRIILNLLQSAARFEYLEKENIKTAKIYSVDLLVIFLLSIVVTFVCCISELFFWS